MDVSFLSQSGWVAGREGNREWRTRFREKMTYFH